MVYFGIALMITGLFGSNMRYKNYFKKCGNNYFHAVGSA
jgi:hypothetical protein